MQPDASTRPFTSATDPLYLTHPAAAESHPLMGSPLLQPPACMPDARSADAAPDQTLSNERKPMGYSCRVLDVNQVTPTPREYFPHSCSRHLHDLRQPGSRTGRTSMYQAKNDVWPVFVIACRHDHLESTLLAGKHEEDLPADRPLVWSPSIRLVRSRPHCAA